MLMDTKLEGLSKAQKNGRVGRKPNVGYLAIAVYTSLPTNIEVAVDHPRRPKIIIPRYGRVGYLSYVF